jgi:Ca2+/Na+ antiporter
LNIALYIAVAIVGASSAAWGTSKMSQHVATIWGESIVVAVLAPVLVLPMLVSATSPGEKDRAGVAATGAMGVVLLNLCVLLPFVIWSAYISRMGDATSRGMIYSIVTWRVDNVVLIAMAFLVLPVALGRWKLGRAEGFTLVALYAVYVLMEAVGVARS